MTEELRRWAIEHAVASRVCLDGDQIVKTAREIEAYISGASDQPLPDGWLRWNGGKQPVEDARVVDVRFVNGTVVRSIASNWSWSRYDTPHDIMAYRAVPMAPPAPPQPEPAPAPPAPPDEPDDLPDPNGINKDAEPVTE